ncbi:Hypothetical protein NTJ_00775 [Nesidiocoris tenuis]|uniref:Uncharacterized protein n=1 Tax=Nesidiocoris tenuis TaxID=355587 RepID=A0ABN7A6Y1_9HEMI|nr:Hypothetical protein NTJ_00775 [Nesidiocoris tenuis]
MLQSRSSPGDGGPSDPKRSMTKLSKEKETSGARIDDTYVLVPLKNFIDKPSSPLDVNKDKNDFLVLHPPDESKKRRKRHYSGDAAKAVVKKLHKFNHTGYPRKRRRTNYVQQNLNQLSDHGPERKKRNDFISDPEQPIILLAAPKTKRKKSLKAHDLATEFDDANGIENLPKITMESDDLGSKMYHRQNVVSKHRKKNDPVNITMHISNLIPSCDVDNTRITNSGKLYKNGCLKFSIQLEKPPAGCADDNTCPCGCEAFSANFVSGMQSKAVDGANSSLTGGNSVVPFGNDKSNRAPQQRPGKTSSDPLRPASQPGDSSAEKNDLGTMLLQLMSSMAEKSHHHTNKKVSQPQAHQNQAQHPQAVLMDSDIVRELQKLLVSPQLAEGTAQESPRIKSQIRTGSSQQNLKAQAIAQLLKHFSKVAPTDRRMEVQNK